MEPVAFSLDKYRYTHNWFSNSELYNHLSSFTDKNAPHRILEIGCYEGLSSCFLADEFLNHAESTQVCVDPFMNFADNDHSQFLMHLEEANFDNNIAHCNNANKITVHKTTSDEYFERILEEGRTFDIIYIDGCHLPEFIERDMTNAFRVLEPHGIMWMDDYLGGDGVQIRKTMDDWVQEHENELEIINTGYQLAVQKK